MSLGIHALRVTVVVAALNGIAGLGARASACQGAHHQSDARTGPGALSAVANGRACGGADHGPDSSALDGGVGLGIAGLRAKIGRAHV